MPPLEHTLQRSALHEAALRDAHAILELRQAAALNAAARANAGYPPMTGIPSFQGLNDAGPHSGRPIHSSLLAASSMLSPLGHDLASRASLSQPALNYGALRLEDRTTRMAGPHQGQTRPTENPKQIGRAHV